MTTAYTSLLGLALPVTGELSGTWGDTVNTAITSLLDTAVAGTTSITVDADITLSTTTGASNEARQAIILWNPASGTVTRNITAPAQSKLYTVINASGGTQSIVIRGAGPTTGVTIAKGESAQVAWNGSDFVKVGSSGGAITFTNLTVTGNTILGDAAADTLTVNATSTFAAPVSFQALVNLPSTGRSAAAALTPTNPAFLYGVASTYTDTTSSGTLAPVGTFYSIARPTLSTSNVTTYTTAATLYIANSPAAGGSATITNPYALYVAAGANYFGGNSTFASQLNVTDTTDSSSTSTGSIVTAGGVGIAKKLYVGLDANIHGLTAGWGPAALNTNTVFAAAGMAANTTGYGSTAVGYAALTSNQTGFSNTALGRETLRLNVSGSYNVAVGNSALDANTADYNTAVGFQSLYSNTSATFNTAVGYAALRSNTASSNTALGFQAGYATTSGSDNTFIGRNAANNNTTGSYNTAFGAGSLQSNTAASNNTAVGYQAAYSNTTGESHAVLGYQALYSNTTNNNSTAIGYRALYASTAFDNTAVGYSVLSSNTSGLSNVGVGGQRTGTSGATLLANTTGSYNTAVGMSAMRENTTGGNNTAHGYQALFSNTTASNNTAVGYQALYTTTADNNTAFGNSAGKATTTGTLNSFIGAGAGLLTTTGNYNTAVGSEALRSNTTASSATAVGYQALYNNTTGSYNTALGYQAGYNITNGTYNVFIGYRAGYTAANPLSGTVSIGSNSGQNVTGRDNTFVGSDAGRTVTTGTQNTFIGGYDAGTVTGAGGAMTTGSYNVILGSYSGNQGGLDIRTANNYIVLADGQGNPRMYWNGSAAQQNGNLTVGGAVTASLSSSSYSTVWVGENNYLGANTSRLSLLLFAAPLANAVARDALIIGEPTAGHILVSPNASNKSIKLIPGSWTSTISMELQDAGSIKLGYGQLEFPATQNASSNANTLDDYEEGDWSPTVVGTTGNPTVSYVIQDGTYVKIGRMVWASVRLLVASISGGSGNFQIGGFPFTCDNDNGNSWTGAIGWNGSGGSFGGGQNPVNFELSGGSTTAYVHYYNSATGAFVDVSVTNVQVGSQIEASIYYRATA